MGMTAFFGGDFLELLKYFNIKFDEDAPDGDWMALQAYLRAMIQWSNQKGIDEEKHQAYLHTVKMCRAFVKKLARRSRRVAADAPLWKGLSKVRDDYTFLDWFIYMCPGAWN